MREILKPRREICEGLEKAHRWGVRLTDIQLGAIIGAQLVDLWVIESHFGRLPSIDFAKSTPGTIHVELRHAQVRITSGIQLTIIPDGSIPLGQFT
jgi:hypothetical protein